MNKRTLTKLEQGEGTTLAGKLLLTRRQRQVLLKWFLYGLLYLLLQVLQDVIFSRLRVLGGCPDLVPGLILLVCILQGPAAGGLFALAASVFRCLSGATLGPVSIVVLTFAGIFLAAFRLAYLRRRFWSSVLCCAAGILIHQALVFLLGLFLGSTTLDRWVAALAGGILACLVCPALYPLVKAIGKIGGETWRE